MYCNFIIRLKKLYYIVYLLMKEKEKKEKTKGIKKKDKTVSFKELL